MDESRVPSEIIGDPFKAARPKPPIFQTASTVLKNNSGSLRNASTGDDLEGASSNNGEASSTSTSQTADGSAPTSSGEQPAPAGPVKPVHRSASSKNAIVYSAVQVSSLIFIEGHSHSADKRFRGGTQSYML